MALALPDHVSTCLFDLDGELTQTAKVHANAWKQMFDGLGNRKTEIVPKIIKEQGVEPYEGSVRYVNAARDAGLHRVVVSSSTNARDVLEHAGIIDLFEDIVDGTVADRDHLTGKPAPDTFVEGAKIAGVDASQAAVFEDALAGVAAGRAGNFGIVVGVDRVGQADELHRHGADVVKDLSELLS
jgi:HAD superfamily hydrolase (TIGR01509 family)